jgi:hypothetical protein
MVRIIFVINLILFSTSIFSQEATFLNDYRSYENIISGVYTQRSTSEEFISLDLPEVVNQIEIIEPNKGLDFIKVKKTSIVLFDSHNIEINKPIGKISSTVPVTVDSVFYKEIYRDYSKPWSISFNVWSRIIIDNKPYYTDCDIHDYSILEPIAELKQKVLIIGQCTGYDYAYHLGYPEYFFLIILNENNEILYESKILDITIGDEFAMKEDFLKTKWNKETKTFELIFFNQLETEEKRSLEVFWNGKEMRIK